MEKDGMGRDAILEPIRVRAYFLWEQAGRPEGGDLNFWDEARRQIEEEDAATDEATAEGSPS